MTGTPEPQPKSFKTLVFNGVVGATALAGTTAIPIFVQRFLQTPAPVTVPAQTIDAPTSATPQTVTPQTVTPQTEPLQAVPADLPQSSDNDDDDDDDDDKGRGKKKQD